MTPADLAPIGIAALLVASALGHQRVLKAAQPLRLEFATKAEQLLASAELPPRVRRHVEFMLNHSFNGLGLLLTAIPALPFLLLFMVFRRKHVIALMDPFESLEPSLKGRLDDIERLHQRITLANHPIVMLILYAEMTLFLPLGLLAMAVLQGRMPSYLDGPMVLNLLESGEARFFDKEQRLA